MDPSQFLFSVSNIERIGEVMTASWMTTYSLKVHPFILTFCFWLFPFFMLDEFLLCKNRNVKVELERIV